MSHRDMTDPQAEYAVTVHPEPVGEWGPINRREPEQTAIVQINQAMQALERASTIQEMVALRDKATALEVFAAAQGFKDAAQVAKVFQLRAERKAGGWLAENIDHEGGRPKQGHDGIVLEDIDISPKESSRWQLEASLPEDRFNEWVDECLAHAWELSAGALRKIAENHMGKHSEADQLPAVTFGMWRSLYSRRLVALRGVFLGWMPAEDAAYIRARLDEVAARLDELAGRVT